jgi:hypothetical protein
MKTLTGIFCLLVFSFPAFGQEAEKKDSMELHVDGKIFITITKEQINSNAVSIPLQRGIHKISWVMRQSEKTPPAKEILVLRETIANVIVRNSEPVKNYSVF